MNPHERFSGYRGTKCWQAYISETNREADLKEINLTETQASELRTSDFSFEYIPKDDKKGCKEVKDFIEHHEWLGKLPTWATHRFVARLYGVSSPAGVIVMATPNTFSHLLGKENKDLEKLIARGACISWAPKNLGSWLVMKSINWMVKNTPFRIFTAYSDPEAKELGTIYQACNFFYLGQNFGSKKQYLDPSNRSRGWFGEAGFSDRSQTVRYAKQLGINMLPEYYKFVGKKKNYRKINWKAIPPDITAQLKQAKADHKQRCQCRASSVKHKYAYICGATPSETKKLKKLFREINPNLCDLKYPKNRGE